MRYEELAEIYESLEGTSKRLDKTFHLAKLFMDASDDEIPLITLLVQGKIFPAWDERKIGMAAKLVIKAIALSIGVGEDTIADLWREKGDLGLVTQELIGKKVQATLRNVELSVDKVFSNFRKLAGLTGTGSVDRKVKLVSALLTSASPLEGKYIVRSILEELRVGVGEGSIRDAIVWASFPPIKGVVEPWEKLKPTEGDEPEDARKEYNVLVGAVQSAYDVLNEFSEVALIARKEGLEGLKRVTLSPGRPVKVMLAQKAPSVEKAFKRVGKPAALEYKYDGFRMQVHKDKSGVRIFTRRLEDVSRQFPEVVEFFRGLEHEFILDGEAVGYEPSTGRFLPFQHISQRIRRKYGIAEMAKKLPVELNLFDLLYLDGKSFLSEPFKARREALEGLIKPEKGRVSLAKQIVTDSDEKAASFYQEALDKGNEGIMFKSLENGYKPGSRVGFMVKLKPTMESLDLVITGAEWGEGKRARWLTSFTLSCVEDGEFKEIGKVGTGIKELEGEGLTFEQLTEMLKPHMLEEKGREVRLKPSLVVEIKYEEIQKSPTYSSGYALRFPRVVGVRDDLNPEEAAPMDLVEEFYDSQ